MIKIGIVGIGHIANFQIEAMEKSNSVVFTDAYDLDQSKYSKLATNVNRYGTLAEMLKEAEADLFLISVPNELHYEIGKQVIEAKRSVILEKPMCTSYEELNNLIRLSKTSGQFISVAFHAAYARDLDWWIDHIPSNKDKYGDLIGFSAGFFDPYILEDGSLSPMSKSLGGSWIDSGINALSVIGKLIDPEDLMIHEARMTQINKFACDQVQGNAIVAFNKNSKRGFGSIDTNWSLGANRKTTTLYYEKATILLQHSEETVYQLGENGNLTVLKDLRNGNARLVNHYVSLFDDLAAKFETKLSNFDHAVQLHRLLLDAKKNSDLHLSVI